ncbi:MAG: hypothetical protein M1831_003505 [Alyxoria varia]|nr:MAG: hypothetical protein M1831_003505 [Alyxoria varia]
MHSYVDSNLAKPAGAGGFGAIYTLTEHGERSPDQLAFKVVKNESKEHAMYLQDEFEMMVRAYLTLNNNQSESTLFRIPIPVAFSRPPAEQAVATVKSSGLAVVNRLSDAQPVQFHKLRPKNAVYAMERIPAMAEAISQRILNKFSPQHTPEQYQIIMCRLYLGRLEPIRRTRFFNSRNYPLDLPGYEWLSDLNGDSNTTLPSATVVAEEMGKALGTINVAGYDGRDIEFVLAGSNSSSHDDNARRNQQWGFYVFDFNQMPPIPTDTEKAAELLRDMFFLNDPYYPRPIPENPLYEAFKRGYHNAINGTEADARARSFFRMIEECQAQRDAHTTS